MKNKTKLMHLEHPIGENFPHIVGETVLLDDLQIARVWLVKLANSDQVTQSLWVVNITAIGRCTSRNIVFKSGLITEH